MPEYIVLVLPPFAHDYPSAPFEKTEGLNAVFSDYLKIAAGHISADLNSFSFDKNNFLEDELKSQYIAYVIASAAGDYFNKNNKDAILYTGYSMGLYSALYLAESITFTAGLDIIRDAFHAIKEITGATQYGMCSITGLTTADIAEIIKKEALNCGIAIQNSECSFLISGLKDEIKRLIGACREEGALNIRELNVTIPYHSHYLKEMENVFPAVLNEYVFEPLKKPVVSLINQKFLASGRNARNEIIRNIYTPLNWYQTQLFLQDLEIRTFVECGPGKALVKNSRFIEGNAHFINAVQFFSE